MDNPIVPYEQDMATQIVAFYRTRDNSTEVAQARAVKSAPMSSSSQGCHCMPTRRTTRPVLLDASLQLDVDLLLAMSQCPLDDNNELHMQTLQTVFQQLTGTTTPCERKGDHWKDIGFQGRDPATDLRGAGFLSLYQLVDIVEDKHFFRAVKQLFDLSLHPDQGFPFCVLAINFTSLCLRSVRDPKMSKLFMAAAKQPNFGGSAVLSTVGLLYRACFVRYLELWLEGGKPRSIMEAGMVWKTLQDTCLANPRRFIATAENFQ